MARVSFRLRKTTGGTGLREHDGVGDDTDGLRADGVNFAPPSVLTEGVDTFFEATSSSYGEVDLSWSLPLDTVDSNPGVPVPTHAVVVYSPWGPPETIASGVVVSESSDSFSVRQSGLDQGEWAYYGLFVRYQSTTGDDYYERVAKLAEIVPFNFGSTLSMWSMVPYYYKVVDTQQGSYLSDSEAFHVGFDNYGSRVGPLLRFLSIFGFEMDRTLTLMQYAIRQKDPHLADEDALSALAFEMGVNIDLDDLGAARLRRLLDEVGAFRRRKGTVPGTSYYTKSLTGSDATVNTSDRLINVASLRVNHIIDPQNTGLVTNISSSRPAGVDESLTPDLYLFSDSPSPASASGEVVHLESPISVAKGDTVSFSIHSGVGVAGNIAWARLVDADTGAVLAHSSSPALRFGAPYFDIVCPRVATVEVEFMVLDVSEFGGSYYLAEVNSIGPYFDGSTVRGGWLLGVSNSVSDFRWEGGAANEHNARSLYGDDYERTKQVLLSVYREVLPIDVDRLYDVTFNNVSLDNVYYITVDGNRIRTPGDDGYVTL